MTTSSRAASLIARFAATSGVGAFPHIARADVVSGLRARIADPTKIDTSSVNLCGPAAFFYCLIHDNPELYARYVIDLYTTGRAQLGSLEIHPGSDCRHCRPDRSKIAPVDWVALASLRDSENTILDYESVDDESSGITMPHSMVSWFEAAGYRHVRNDTNVYFTKDPADIHTADHLRLQGRRVCLFINSNMLYQRTITDSSWFPDHWVTLTSLHSSGRHQFVVEVFSWGSIYRIPRTGSVDIDQFCNNLYGFVAALYPPRH